MKIVAAALGTCAVLKGGEGISLGLIDDNGGPVEVTVSAPDAGAIAMTLPRLLSDSLRQKYSDESLRYVFPLDRWQIERASDGRQVIVTLSTGQGFEVSFAMRPDMCRSLANALQGSGEIRLLRVPS